MKKEAGPENSDRELSISNLLRLNNTRTLKLKAQPTNMFFATVKLSAAPPSFRLLPSNVSLSAPCSTILITARSAVVGS